MSLLIFSITSWLNLGRWYVSRNLSNSFRLSIFFFVGDTIIVCKKFLGQGSDQSHSNENAKSLTDMPPGNFCVVHFLGIELFIIISCDPLYSCDVGCNLSFLQYWFDLSGPSIFVFTKLAKSISIFIFSKNHLLVLLVFYIFRVSLISALICIISFLLLIWGFVCSFSLVHLDIMLSCLRFFSLP